MRLDFHRSGRPESFYSSLAFRARVIEGPRQPRHGYERFVLSRVTLIEGGVVVLLPGAATMRRYRSSVGSMIHQEAQ